MKSPLHHCSSCRKIKEVEEFGFKKDGQLYLTCVSCRAKSSNPSYYTIDITNNVISIKYANKETITLTLDANKVQIRGKAILNSSTCPCEIIRNP